MNVDLIAFCKNYYEATHMPLDLLRAGECVWSALAGPMGIEPAPFTELYPLRENPSYCALSEDISYGRVHVEDSDYDIILGPAFAIPVSDAVVRQFMNALELPREKRDTIADVLSSLPVTSQVQLALHMTLVYHCVNGGPTEVPLIYQETEPKAETRETQQLQRMDRLESEGKKNSYLFEVGMYECIKSGQEQRLKDYLETHAKQTYEGQLASTPLRHAKNIFITAAAKASMIGAIPGGMNADAATQLTEYYIRECEKLTSVGAVSNMMYAMLLDFCRRTGEAKLPAGVSSDVFSCMNYIRSHVNESISLRDLADYIQRSESYVMKRFASELGMRVSAYITKCKLEEACSMLVYTEKSLAEISAYLCFSSQAYFQNVFKKAYGITPMQYRRQGRTM